MDKARPSSVGCLVTMKLGEQEWAMTAMGHDARRAEKLQRGPYHRKLQEEGVHRNCYRTPEPMPRGKGRAPYSKLLGISRH